MQKERPDLRNANADAPSWYCGFKKKTPVDRCQGNLRLPGQLISRGLFDNLELLYGYYMSRFCVIPALHGCYMKVIQRKSRYLKVTYPHFQLSETLSRKRSISSKLLM